MENDAKISDENLIKYFSKEILGVIARLFSIGSFKEIFIKYFYINKENENQINQNDNKSNDDKPNIQNDKTNNKNNEKENDEVENELNYELIQKVCEDKLSHQILFTILFFCILKDDEIANLKTIETLIKINECQIEESIFPFNFLIIKYHIKTKNFQQAINIINTLIKSYEDYNMNIEEKKLDLKNIITIETFGQKFIYFDNLFNYLFNMNNIEAKIKKLYFELKTCYYQIKCFSAGFEIILNLYQKYPEDILIQFELAKDSIICSKPDIYEKILEKMKKNKEEAKDNHIKDIYNNFILYLEGLSKIAYNKYDEAKNKFDEILENEENKNNVIIQNNSALLNIYQKNLKEGYDKLVNIYQDKSNENKSEYIRDTIKVIQEKFNIKK